MFSFQLIGLPKEVRYLIAMFLLCLVSGTTVGMLYLTSTTHLQYKGVAERYAGSETVLLPEEKSILIEELDIDVQHYPKSYNEMLLTTHNHLLSMSVFFFLNAFIFNMSSFARGWLKNFLMIEPLLSLLVTFVDYGGLDLLRLIFLGW